MDTCFTLPTVCYNGCNLEMLSLQDIFTQHELFIDWQQNVETKSV